MRMSETILQAPHRTLALLFPKHPRPITRGRAFCEARHYHHQARQFFMSFQARPFWKRKEASTEFPLVPGIEVAPGIQHKFMNRSDQDVVFLVISARSTKADRIDVE